MISRLVLLTARPILEDWGSAHCEAALAYGRRLRPPTETIVVWAPPFACRYDSMTHSCIARFYYPADAVKRVQYDS